MSREDERLLVFGEAAAAAVSRGQTPAAVRLLVIVAAEAAEAGCGETAEAARGLLLKLAPRHALGRAGSVGAGLRDAEISQIVSSVRKSLPFEEAELWCRSRPADDRPAAEPGATACRVVSDWLDAAATPRA